jgi:hypothetical protein
MSSGKEHFSWRSDAVSQSVRTSGVSDESIPERGGRMNVSELARSYHAATKTMSTAIILTDFLSDDL